MTFPNVYQTCLHLLTPSSSLLAEPSTHRSRSCSLLTRILSLSTSRLIGLELLCIQDILSSHALGLLATCPAFRPSARVRKGMLHTRVSGLTDLLFSSLSAGTCTTSAFLDYHALVAQRFPGLPRMNQPHHLVLPDTDVAEAGARVG